MTNEFKIYHGFCWKAEEAKACSSSSDDKVLNGFFEKRHSLKSTSETVTSLCKSNNVKRLRLFVSSPDNVLLDQSFVSVLKYITRLDLDSTGAKQMFDTLMAKDFSCSSLRPHLEASLEGDEVIRIADLVVDYLSEHSPNFEQCLEFALLLFECYFDKMDKDQQNGSSDKINESLSNLKAMIELCSEYKRIESSAKTTTVLPHLMEGPRSEYFIERMELECINFGE